jgi:hypothetical protein
MKGRQDKGLLIAWMWVVIAWVVVAIVCGALSSRDVRADVSRETFTPTPTLWMSSTSWAIDTPTPHATPRPVEKQYLPIVRG